MKIDNINEMESATDTFDTKEVFEGETTRVLTKEELDKKKAQAENSNQKGSEFVRDVLNNKEFEKIAGDGKKATAQSNLNIEKTKAKTTGNPKIRVNKDTLEEVRKKFPHLTDAECIERLWSNYLVSSDDTIKVLQQAPIFNLKDKDKDIENLKKMIDIVIESVRRDAEIYALEMQTVVAKANIDYIEKSKKQVTNDYLKTRMALKSIQEIEDTKDKEIEELKQAHSKEIEGLKAELETANNSLVEKDKLVTLLEDKNTNLEQQQETLNEEIEQLKETYLGEINSLKETHVEEVEKLKSENKSLLDGASTSKAKLEELKNTVNELKEENIRLTANYKDALVSQKELELLNKEISSLKEENTELKAKTTNVEIDALKLEFANSQISSLVADKNNLVKDKEMLLEEKSNLQDELKALKKELEELKKSQEKKTKTKTTTKKEK